ncbi:MAG: indole-3-glycerol phosphate synthase TrpC [Actinomycetota bacterium]
MGFLSDVVADLKRDLEMNPIDDSALMGRIGSLPPARDFTGALKSGNPAVVAEVKRASPSAGEIAQADAGKQAAVYEAAGAAAVSVLTEPKHFDGAMADLRAVRMATKLPVLRKDFLVHPSQLIQTRAEGADAALLIGACLSESEIAALLITASDLGLAALAEATNGEDLDKILAAGAEIVGVNARDLETLEVDEGNALALLRAVPDDKIAVFESGISTREQVERAVEAGANAVLVGEALMRAADPGAKIKELLGEQT